MIENVFIHQFRIGEYVQFAAYVLKAFAKMADKPEKLQVRIDELEAWYKELMAAYSREQGNELTEEVETLDARRDRAEKCLKFIAVGYTFHFDPAKRTAGQLILKAYQKFGASISRMNYLIETAALTKLVSELDGEDALKQAVETIQQLDVVNEIKASNEAFEAIYFDRSSSNAQKTDKSAYELRADVKLAYSKLINRFEACVELSEGGKYDVTVAEINDIIKSFNKLVEGRTSKEIEAPESVE